MKKNLPALVSDAGEMSDIGQTVAVAEEFLPAHMEFGTGMGMVLDLPNEELGKSVAAALNTSTRLQLGSGVALLKMRATSKQGEFGRLLAENQIPRQRAAELMKIADAVARANPEDRERLLGQSKVVLIGLSRMDEEVRAEFLASGKLDKRLTIAEYQAQLAERDAALIDERVRADKAEAETAALRKLAERGAREDAIPYVIADLRAEATVLAKQASLAVESFGPLAEQITRLTALDAEMPNWADGTVRLVLAGLAAQRMLVEAQIGRWLNLLPENESNPLPDAFSYLSPTEIQGLAREWPKLTALHEHAQALRAWEREQERPRSKGRPSAKPVAPKV